MGTRHAWENYTVEGSISCHNGTHRYTGRSIYDHLCELHQPSQHCTEADNGRHVQQLRFGAAAAVGVTGLCEQPSSSPVCRTTTLQNTPEEPHMHSVLWQIHQEFVTSLISMLLTSAVC